LIIAKDYTIRYIKKNEKHFEKHFKRIAPQMKILIKWEVKIFQNDHAIYNLITGAEGG